MGNVSDLSPWEAYVDAKNKAVERLNSQEKRRNDLIDEADAIKFKTEYNATFHKADVTKKADLAKADAAYKEAKRSGSRSEAVATFNAEQARVQNAYIDTMNQAADRYNSEQKRRRKLLDEANAMPNYQAEYNATLEKAGATYDAAAAKAKQVYLLRRLQ